MVTTTDTTRLLVGGFGPPDVSKQLKAAPREVELVYLVDQLYICLRTLRRDKRVESLQHAVTLCQRISALGYNPVVLSKGRVTGAQVADVKAFVTPTYPVKAKPEPQLCPMCKEVKTSGTVSYRRWQQSSALKAAVPTLSWQTREHIIKHTCKKCWLDLFPKEPYAWKENS